MDSVTKPARGGARGRHNKEWGDAWRGGVVVLIFSLGYTVIPLHNVAQPSPIDTFVLLKKG